MDAANALFELARGDGNTLRQGRSEDTHSIGAIPLVLTRHPGLRCSAGIDNSARVFICSRVPNCRGRGLTRSFRLPANRNAAPANRVKLTCAANRSPRTTLANTSLLADEHAGCSSRSAPMKERRTSQDTPNVATAPPLCAQVALQQQAGKFWLPQAGANPGALQPHTVAVDASSGDAAALAQSQALYQQHLRLLLLQTLQWNNCATSDSAASAGVSGTTKWPTVRPRCPLSAVSQSHR